jgi:hypothetical protein
MKQVEIIDLTQTSRDMETQTPDSDIKKIKREWKRIDKVEDLMYENILTIANSAWQLGHAIGYSHMYERDNEMWKSIQARLCCFISPFGSPTTHSIYMQQQAKVMKRDCLVCARNKWRETRNSILCVLYQTSLKADNIHLILAYLKVTVVPYTHWF